jgi:hypothetical protein
MLAPMRGASVLLVAVAACVPAISFEGKRCDDAHPCPEGLICTSMQVCESGGDVGSADAGCLPDGGARPVVFQMSPAAETFRWGDVLDAGFPVLAVPMSGDYQMFLHVVDPADPGGNVVSFYLAGTPMGVHMSTWSGQQTFFGPDYGLTWMGQRSGDFPIVVGISDPAGIAGDGPANRFVLCPGPGVTVDTQQRYRVGTLHVP